MILTEKFVGSLLVKRTKNQSNAQRFVSIIWRDC